MKKQLEVVKWDAGEGFALSPRYVGTGLQRFPAVCLEKIQSLKERVSGELAWRFAGVRPEFLRQAVNEAAALAASTPFPTLFLPTLAEEKVFLASEWERKQRVVQERSWLRAA